MSEHLYYDYMCLKCGEQFLPLKEEGMKCPKCGDCATLEEGKAPSVAEVVEAAWANIDWPILLPCSVADLYMINALGTIKFILAGKHVPSTDAEVDALAEYLIAQMDFSSGEHQRSHALTFTKAVIREFRKISTGGSVGK